MIGTLPATDFDQGDAVVVERWADDGVGAFVEQLLCGTLCRRRICWQFLDDVLDVLSADAPRLVDQVDLDAGGFRPGLVGEPAEVAEVGGVSDRQWLVERAVARRAGRGAAGVPVGCADVAPHGALVARSCHPDGAAVVSPAPVSDEAVSSSSPHATTSNAPAANTEMVPRSRMVPP